MRLLSPFAEVKVGDRIFRWGDGILKSVSVTSSEGQAFSFEVDAFKKHCLLNGLDDIGLTMEKASSIETFETEMATTRPWVRSPRVVHGALLTWRRTLCLVWLSAQDDVY